MPKQICRMKGCGAYVHPGYANNGLCEDCWVAAQDSVARSMRPLFHKKEKKTGREELLSHSVADLGISSKWTLSRLDDKGIITVGTLLSMTVEKLSTIVGSAAVATIIEKLAAKGLKLRESV